jgi:hypothetical protein
MFMWDLLSVVTLDPDDTQTLPQGRRVGQDAGS